MTLPTTAQIANAEAALAKEKEGSKEYQKIETNLFNLRRDSEQARNKLVARKPLTIESKKKKRLRQNPVERVTDGGKD